MSILAACGHAFVAWLHTLHDFPKKEIVSILFKRGALGRDGPSTVSLDYQMSRDNEVSKDVPWYIEGLGARLKPSVRAFYEAYTGLEGEALETHLHEIRDEAWDVAPYPCIGMWIFVQQPLITLPGYDKALDLALQGGIVLDMGCGLGQDLRRLAFEGVPTEQMWGFDLDRKLWDIGYKLFDDEDTMQAQIIEEDIFKSAPPPSSTSSQSPKSLLLGKLEGKVDIVLAFLFLHLFSEADQIRICEVIVRLSKLGTMVLGSGAGSSEPRHEKTPWGQMYFHDATTFKKMWRTVGQKTGTKWTVSYVYDVSFVHWGYLRMDTLWLDKRNFHLDFVVERVK